ncbi:hypothetical protein Acsp02_24310 [Actinoplanes sp. NBRC 103695]|nr:hypothetical protein Acsp02_24310 [Actinoplanes sp. NBRC 103695]
MFVGDVYFARVARSPVMLSDTRPVCASVIATIDRHVSFAQVLNGLVAAVAGVAEKIKIIEITGTSRRLTCVPLT